MNTKLYVNNVLIGISWCALSEWDVNLKQRIETEKYFIWQLAYYWRDFGSYFAIYAIQDHEGNQEEYLIDSEKFNDEIDEKYDAERIDNDKVNINQLIMKMVLENM